MKSDLKCFKPSTESFLANSCMSSGMAYSKGTERLAKRGDQPHTQERRHEECTNYRRISLKLHGKWCSEIIEPTLEGNRCRCGFRPEVLCFCRNPCQCALQIFGNALQQAEELEHLEVVFTSDGRQNKKVDTWIGKANAVLRELYRSVVTKRELSNIVKLSVFKSVFVPILAFGHSLILGKDWKCDILCANGRDEIFAKTSRRDTLRQSAQLLKS